MVDSITVKVKDQDENLTINPDLLTSNSPVFDRLINELSQTEIEMEEFNTETVTLFLSLLDSEEKKIEVMESQSFRQLHKMTVVFEVEWMMKECHRHLMDKLNFYVFIKEYGWETTILVWEECKYMVETWGDRFMGFVDLLNRIFMSSREDASTLAASASMTFPYNSGDVILQSGKLIFSRR